MMVENLVLSRRIWIAEISLFIAWLSIHNFHMNPFQVPTTASPPARPGFEELKFTLMLMIYGARRLILHTYGEWFLRDRLSGFVGVEDGDTLPSSVADRDPNLVIREGHDAMLTDPAMVLRFQLLLQNGIFGLRLLHLMWGV